MGLCNKTEISFFSLEYIFKAGEAKGFVASSKSFEAISPSGVKIKFVPPAGTVKQWRAWPVK